MAMMLLDRTPAPPVREHGLDELVAAIGDGLARAVGASMDALDDQALGGVVAELARIESRTVALRLAVSAEADRRQVAQQTAETGTDAWLARLTGSTREQMAGGLRL
ncbi:MAG TPA: hypothetical protein VFI21_07875, partial [Nocardioides sp.]|nr:hypothetical protein [Nocardioides sp.]